MEFAEHRPYQAGDEPRHVDWKIAARADRWAVKQYEEETNLRATIVLDVSRSMAWSGAAPARLTKLAYAERLAAAIALLFLRQRDAVGLVRFDDVVRSSVPPRVRTGQWVRLVAALEEPGAGRASHARRGARGGGAAHRAARDGRAHLRSARWTRCEVVATVRGLRHAGHQVVVLHVLDPAELDLPQSERGAVRRSGERLEVAATRRRCARRVSAHGARGDRRVAPVAHGVRSRRTSR